MEDTGTKVKHHFNQVEPMSIENEEDDFLLRQKVFQRMNTDIENQFNPQTQQNLKDDSAFLKEVTPSDDLNNSRNTLENPE